MHIFLLLQIIFYPYAAPHYRGAGVMRVGCMICFIQHRPCFTQDMPIIEVQPATRVISSWTLESSVPTIQKIKGDYTIPSTKVHSAIQKETP